MTTEKVPKWESELWSYMSSDDGVNCPVHDTCQTRLTGEWCLDDNKQLFEELYGGYINQSRSDKDEVNDFRSLLEDMIPPKWKPGPIFQLVEALANKYLKKAKLDHPPVMTDAVGHFNISPQIEVRPLPLKAYHGAVWRLEDGWVIHLNSNNKPARQKSVLFHEVFHILAHNKATPIFRKRGLKEGLFNEMLADYFAGCFMMPRTWIDKKWAELKDLKQMAEAFQVTEVAIWIRLKAMGLI